MNKDMPAFAAPEFIVHFFENAERHISSVAWEHVSREEFIRGMARVYAEINHSHPFREGNGRTGKLFLSQLSGTPIVLSLP
jgi:cell filamentation protein